LLFVVLEVRVLCAILGKFPSVISDKTKTHAVWIKNLDAEQRGSKTKKHLAIDPIEAEVVRPMFKLFLKGNGTSGPMGVKALISWPNERGYRTRVGARWGIHGQDAIDLQVPHSKVDRKRSNHPTSTECQTRTAA
jgi:hypothetical protein